MPVTFLNAFQWVQGAVGFGLAAYFFAMHIGVREWMQLPMVQSQLSKHSPRRLAFGRIYVRTFAVVMSLATAVCLAFAGFYGYQTFALSESRIAGPNELADAIAGSCVIIAGQVFIVLTIFIQFARSRRALRRMALGLLKAQAEADSVAEAAETKSN